LFSRRTAANFRRVISTLALARLCGTSQGTVDRALHDRPGVSAKTRERILRAAAKHGHRPHPGMREILTGRSDIVQAAFPSINNVFFMDLAAHLATELRKKGLRLQLTLVEDAAELQALLEDAAARRHRLAVFVPPADKISVPVTLSKHLPLVTLLDPCRGNNVPFVSPDERRTGRDGVDHLYRLGHREIVFVSYRRQAHAIVARATGYQERMRELGLRPRVVFSVEPTSWGTPMPTALFCHNDWLAIQAILSLRQHGLSVPQQMSVLGVDGSPTLAALRPGLSTMAYPIEEVTASILARLDNKTRSLEKVRFRVIAGETAAKAG
jgi:DNA-binding LacI/PurR family transcriptional regulator